MGIRLATLLVVPIVVVLALSPLALAASPALTLKLVMKRYDNSVLMDLYLNYINASARVLSHGLRVDAEVTTEVVHNSTMIARYRVSVVQFLASSPPFEAANKFHIVVRSRSPNATTSLITVSGVMTTFSQQASGNVSFYAKGSLKLTRSLVYLVSFRGLVAIQKSAIPKDQRKEFLNNLEMVSALLSPAFVNAMLDRANITWIKVRGLSVDVGQNSSYINLRYSVTAAISILGYAQWIKSSRVSAQTPLGPLARVARASPEAIVDLARELLKLNITRSSYATIDARIVPGYLISVSIVGNVSARGNITGYYRFYAKYASSMLLRNVNSSTVSRYLSELVILPYNTTMKLAMRESRGSGLEVSLGIINLRVGHAYLKGEEGVERVATILSSMISGLKIACAKLGLPASISYSTQGVSFSPNPSIAQAFAKAFIRALSRVRPPTIATTVTITRSHSPPPPLVQTTTSIAPQQTTTLPASSTPSLTTVLKEITVSIRSYITKTVVSRETLTRTVTTTYTSTITVTIPHTVIKEVKVASYGLAIALLIVGLAVGGGVAYALARRR
ncbi:MAG: hypothetical protein GXO32_00235 [Crenarchaeota archaeon]|nr:hypothetical protein [Thermoproteota archaeon]